MCSPQVNEQGFAMLSKWLYVLLVLLPSASAKMGGCSILPCIGQGPQYDRKINQIKKTYVKKPQKLKLNSLLLNF
jgi:hypothetical protein